MEHSFTTTIQGILEDQFRSKAAIIFEASPLLQYVNLKTRSANSGSKARGSFANLYALYVLVEDYLSNGFDRGGNYSEYPGAVFSTLFRRQRELPFGSKLQNHGLNHRLNEEFKHYFPASTNAPILRDQTGRYWINENLLWVAIEGPVSIWRVLLSQL